ncbi:hypothetical protein [Candidatus Caldatribacterium sp.]|uniref:hypothetical protein n=1 Tax=Candidatus Caldatribacterium sp. TaxID=2282143 RepID=UPI00383F5092|nr:hypothetical protein [Candidatus Caldatribacterium sp.]
MYTREDLWNIALGKQVKKEEALSTQESPFVKCPVCPLVDGWHGGLLDLAGSFGSQLFAREYADHPHRNGDDDSTFQLVVTPTASPPSLKEEEIVEAKEQWETILSRFLDLAGYEEEPRTFNTFFILSRRLPESMFYQACFWSGYTMVGVTVPLSHIRIVTKSHNLLEVLCEPLGPSIGLILPYSLWIAIEATCEARRPELFPYYRRWLLGGPSEVKYYLKSQGPMQYVERLLDLERYLRSIDILIPVNTDTIRFVREVYQLGFKKLSHLLTTLRNPLTAWQEKLVVRHFINRLAE